MRNASALAALAAFTALAALAPLSALADRLVAAGPVAILAVAAVVAVLPLALGRLASVQHPLPLKAIVAVLLICENEDERIYLYVMFYCNKQRCIGSVSRQILYVPKLRP